MERARHWSYRHWTLAYRDDRGDDWESGDVAPRRPPLRALETEWDDPVAYEALQRASLARRNPPRRLPVLPPDRRPSAGAPPVWSAPAEVSDVCARALDRILDPPPVADALRRLVDFMRANPQIASDAPGLTDLFDAYRDL